MKLWIKLIKGEKVRRGIVRVVRDDFDGLTEDLRGVCNELDIPTPMLLKSRYEQLMNFNMLRFRADDFIETINFDSMYLENVVEVK